MRIVTILVVVNSGKRGMASALEMAKEKYRYKKSRLELPSTTPQQLTLLVALEVSSNL